MNRFDVSEIKAESSSNSYIIRNKARVLWYAATDHAALSKEWTLSEFNRFMSLDDHIWMDPDKLTTMLKELEADKLINMTVTAGPKFRITSTNRVDLTMFDATMWIVFDAAKEAEKGRNLSD